MPAVTPAAAATTPVVDWSNIENIRGEWPRAGLDPAADLQGFQRALILYERDDYASMMQCATLFATALAHSLYGPGILKGEELAETVRKTLYTVLFAPPDGFTFAESAQKAARLAMTVMRENGWQPPSFGGTRTWYEPMMMDKGNYMLLGIAAGGNLRTFFSVAQPTISALPDADVERGRESLAHIYGIIQESKKGDIASSLYVDGMALFGKGDYEGAIAKYSEAANLGSVDAMAAAGDLSANLGRQEDANFWFESAANAGHSIGMFNTAIAAVQKGDHATAQQWFQRSAEAGNVEGYAALTQLADEADDEVAEAHWSRLGAEAGQLFCMGRYGVLLARDANGDVPTMRRSRDFLEQAADRGHLDSAIPAIAINHELGDPGRAQRYVTLVVQSGDLEGIDQLRQWGLH